MEFHNLPNEIVSKIILFLDGKDILKLSTVNRQLNELCDCHTTWLNIMKQYKTSEPSFYDFTLESLSSMNWKSLKSLYINVIEKWGWLIGSWKRHISAYGGLLFVKVRMSPCQVVGYDVLSVELEMNLVPMFEINISENDSDLLIGNPNCFTEGRIRCTLYSKTEHYFTIERNIECPEEIEICCLKGDSGDDHDKEQMISDFGEALGRNSFEITNAIFDGFYNGGISLSKINVPPISCDNKIVEPGFFAGDYGAHGTEILLLKYDSSSILLEKVTGDKNVRCGAVSIDIDMNCPVDYIKVLKFIAKQPNEFNIKDILNRFQARDDSWQEDESCYHVERGLVQVLKSMFPERTFGIDETDNSFIAAFKGKITLGMMPDAVIPDYFYHEVLVVITNENSLYVYWGYHALDLGFDSVAEMPYKRLCF